MSISQIQETKTAAFLHSIHISFAVTFCERGSNIDSSCRGDPGKENEKHLIIRNVMFGILEKCQPLVSIPRIIQKVRNTILTFLPNNFKVMPVLCRRHFWVDGGEFIFATALKSLRDGRTYSAISIRGVTKGEWTHSMGAITI